MTNENPYQPPESDVDPGLVTNGLDEKIFYHLSRGQKMATKELSAAGYKVGILGVKGGYVA